MWAGVAALKLFSVSKQGAESAFARELFVLIDETIDETSDRSGGSFWRISAHRYCWVIAD